jgi:4,5-dihydroxyphthalate decarboxylase
MPELHEIFARFTFNREWDVSELSFAKFSTQITRPNPDIVALPIVCSRHFRFSAFYVNKKSGIKSPKDLKGKKVGSPEWAHTAAVYMRGWLNDEQGVALTDVDWHQAGTNEPGRTEKVEINLPKGVRLTRHDDTSLSEMVAKGEIDCALVARPPDCFLAGHPDVVRLFPNYLEMEEQYYARTKVWPIMHVIAMKRSILEQYPWVAGSLYNAFNESKNRALGRMFEQSVSRYPLPWLTTYARRMRDMFDGDPFPFGIDENRATFEQFLRYTHEQGIAHRHAKVDEIFPKGMMVEVHT